MIGGGSGGPFLPGRVGGSAGDAGFEIGGRDRPIGWKTVRSSGGAASGIKGRAGLPRGSEAGGSGRSVRLPELGGLSLSFIA